MSISDREWADVAAMLETFPGDFQPRHARVYRHLLKGLSYEQIVGAIRRHVRQGERWRPSPGEIVALAGAAVVLPPFGMVRETLIAACRTTGVRLAREGQVTDALCAEIESSVAQQFVIAVGGSRIRRVALYVGDADAERAWESLERDYKGLAEILHRAAFQIQAGQPVGELEG